MISFEKNNGEGLQKLQNYSEALKKLTIKRQRKDRE